MVTISGYKVRVNHEGKSFVSLELTGEIELIQSSNTGAFYATAKRCSIPSTFTEEQVKGLFGSKLKGTIKRVKVEPYEYTIKETGEVIVLTHSYAYEPEEANTEVREREKLLVSA
jgi:hypothetical protein